jgi:transcriptional regulator with XRE-family HTH domain
MLARGASSGSGAAASVGARIRAARAARGWTQDALAEAVGVSRSAVAQWETDRAGQLRDTIPRIAEALGVSVEHLLTGEDRHAPREAATGDELALLRLYRECDPEDRQFLLRTARKLARTRA